MSRISFVRLPERASPEEIRKSLNLQLPEIAKVASEPEWKRFVNTVAAYSVGVYDEIVYADATAGAFEVTLPPARESVNREYTILRLNGGGNAVTVVGTINGGANHSLSSQYAKVTLHSDGIAYFILG